MPETLSHLKLLIGAIAAASAPPRETIHRRDQFDPAHGLTELRYAARRGLIAILSDHTDPSRFTFHLTNEGRRVDADWKLQRIRHPAHSTLRRVASLLNDLTTDNPAPQETWVPIVLVSESSGSTTIDAAVARGYIEVSGPPSDLTTTVRFTPRGRRVQVVLANPLTRTLHGMPKRPSP